MMVPDHWPVFGICGFSGSGKTTLIERVLPSLTARGLAVAVVKHDAHRLTVDVGGKDTDRFFQAGGTVVGHDLGQAMMRWVPDPERFLHRILARLLVDHDLVLVEGHKDTHLPAKVWLDDERGEPPPSVAGPWLARWARSDDRVAAVMRLLTDWLALQLHRQPLRAGILVGGASRRMGSPKQLLEYRGQPWIVRVAEALTAHVSEVCLLGGGEVPVSLAGAIRIPDAPSHRGPTAGMLAALRWDPRASWVFAACDMPRLTPAAVGWLLDCRVPGRWAVLPRQATSRQVEPLGAWYDQRMAAVLEQGDRPISVVDHPKVRVVDLPAGDDAAWRSYNARADLADLA